MLKNLKKFLLLIILVIAISITMVESVQASNTDSEVRTAFNNFIKCINNQDENVYNYIDISNTELYNNITSYLNALSINSQIINVTEENNVYNIETLISASGINWNVSGHRVEFKLEKIEGQYKVIYTNLFEFIGIENVESFVFQIINSAFKLVGGIFLVITIIIVIVVIVVIIVIICINKKKKSKEKYL